MSAKGQKRTDTVGANQSCRIALNQNDGHPKGYVLLGQAIPSCSEAARVTGGGFPTGAGVASQTHLSPKEEVYMGILDELLGGGQRQKEYRDFVNRYEQGHPSEGYYDQEVLKR